MAGKLVNVEAGRGIASLLVVFYHAEKYYFETEKYWTDGALGGFFRFGHAGVEFFFVLSGYIMYAVHKRDIGNPAKVMPFVQKRFDRIYPFFWLVMAVTVALYFAVPSAGEAIYRDPWIILQSALLVGWEPLDAVVFVSWTMWHEILFYSLCALVIASPRIGVPAFALWIAASAVVTLSGFQAPWPTYWTMFLNVLFALGVGAAVILEKHRVPMPRLVLALGALIFFGTGIWSNHVTLSDPVSNSLFGIGATLALLGGVQSERDGHLRAPRWMVTLGAASFAIYLTHMLSLTALAKLSVRLHLPTLVPAPVAYLGLVLGATLAGIVIHYLVEIHLMGLTQRWSRRRAAAVADSGPVA